MEKLYLDTLHLNPYNEKAACAYICYGKKDEEQPKDHKGQPIGAFYQDAEDFSKHLTQIVLPLLEQRLNNLGYVIQGIDYLNQAPHPFFSIRKKDGKDLTDSDLKDLAGKIERILSQANKDTIKLFKNPTPSAENTEEKSNKTLFRIS